MACIRELNKQEKEQYLPILFDILYENMVCLASMNGTYAQERDAWIDCISEALEKPQRRIWLCQTQSTVVGFVQYYIRDTLLVIEELQIASAYRRTLLFPYFCRQFAKALPEGIESVEAYAIAQNVDSLNLMAKLGMRKVGMDGPFLHLRGDFDEIQKHFSAK